MSTEKKRQYVHAEAAHIRERSKQPNGGPTIAEVDEYLRDHESDGTL